MIQPLPLACKQLVALLPQLKPVSVWSWVRTAPIEPLLMPRKPLPTNWSRWPTTARRLLLDSVRLPLDWHDRRLNELVYWTPSPMPQAARTRGSKFLDWVAITEPWLKPPTTMPFEQSALARAHRVLTTLVDALGLKMQRALPWIVAQLLKL